ncbi:hypothetical protein BKA70DRAFT_72488 [Coprinopsis sp. MPI-PUGE-AT-0042]|nr:hypothetical protein BKA70DRAFT_72488 [Coprinopsis sp. MPI-PUGE-AT-0042]
MSDHISVLPPEILLQVFNHALPGPLLREGRLHFQAIRSVCSEWRLLSFSSPALWSSLAVQHIGGDLFPYIGNAVKKWLSRAGPSLPLEIRLVDTSLGGMSEKDSKALCELVIHYQPRWKSLFFCGTGRCLWDVFQKAPSSNWINLRELAVWTYRLRDDLGRGGVEVLSRIPSIQLVPVQVLHLTVVTGNIIVATGILNVISTYTYLKTLSLTTPQAHVQPSDSSATMVLPFLELLSIAGQDFTILHHLNTPVLAELKVHLLHDVGSQALDTDLHGFLTRSTNLYSISLRGNGKHMAIMAPTLCARPTITSVTLQPWPDGLGDHIPPRNMSWWDSWCPNLRELTVVVQSANSILENEKEMKLLTSLVSFLHGRKTIGRRRLTRLVFKNSYGATDFPYEIFGTLDVGKLDVMVRW